MVHVYAKSQIPEHLQKYFRPAEYGLEASPAEYVETMRALFLELRRVLADDGTLWLNIGDSYIGGANSGGANQNDGGPAVRIKGLPPKRGLPAKNLLGIPWRVAFALQDDGWILRNAIIWNKPNAMPESVTDRLSGRYEMVFMLSKKPRYWFDLDPIREPHIHVETLGVYTKDRAERPQNGAESSTCGTTYNMGFSKNGKNPGDVWNINTQPFSASHFAVMPRELAQRCILAGCKPGGTVLDPFNGSGTTGLAAQKTGRKYVGIDISRDYLDLTLSSRLQQSALDFEGSA